MKKYRLKKPAIIALYSLAIVAFLGTMFLIEKSFFETNLEKDEDYDYVSKTVFENDIPVVNTDKVIIRPYTDKDVKLVKNYYDYQAEESVQKDALLYYESTYLQNSGVAYGGKEDGFDVISILDGTVIDVKEDHLLGKIVEVRHGNDMISVYQSLSDVKVKKDDVIKQGTVIGKSGTSNISKELNSHLHFELIVKGQLVNPEKYYDKKVDEL